MVNKNIEEFDYYESPFNLTNNHSNLNDVVENHIVNDNQIVRIENDDVNVQQVLQSKTLPAVQNKSFETY